MINPFNSQPLLPNFQKSKKIYQTEFLAIQEPITQNKLEGVHPHQIPSPDVPKVGHILSIDPQASKVLRSGLLHIRKSINVPNLDQLLRVQMALLKQLLHEILD